MRVDIYKRAEPAGRFTYLAVPEGKLIPQEATNIDWEAAQRSLDLNEGENNLAQFLIEDPFQQIDAKGYAITSIKNLTDNR